MSLYSLLKKTINNIITGKRILWKRVICFLVSDLMDVRESLLKGYVE